MDWLRGPKQNLTDSPSYPSGHTTYGYTESLLLALLVPERYQQMVARGAEYGNNRIVVGAHYAMLDRTPNCSACFVEATASEPKQMLTKTSAPLLAMLRSAEL